MREVQRDNAPEQVANVASLPGIVNYSMAMPDIHWGYGFPIGGVAAFEVNDGIISPGGVGYDINCGVRLLRTDLYKHDVESKLNKIVPLLFNAIPSGVGSKGQLRLPKQELKKVLREGAGWAVQNGYGDKADLDKIEENGSMAGADPDTVSERALQRGQPQLGTLGSGNHFVEVGYVDEVFEPQIAKTLHLAKNQITITIHTGSRGLGHQVCDDYIKTMLRAAVKYSISLPDRQLCCAPVGSSEGRRYYSAMACAVNFAFCNRQMISFWTGEAFCKALGKSPAEVNLQVVYEVAHNIAKLETHTIDAEQVSLCVHRKGATRAFPPLHPDIPEEYREVGQPVLIPGDMGRYSYVLVGTQRAMEETFGSTCHGAGRLMSRKQATKKARGRSLFRELQDKGVLVMASSHGTMAEEMPEAYKDVAEVVEAVHRAGISVKVARLKPMGVIKG